MVLEDNTGSRFTDLWFLTDSWSQEAKWTEGRVKIDIKDSHVEDFQYKVSITNYITEPWLTFAYLKVAQIN